MRHQGLVVVRLIFCGITWLQLIAFAWPGSNLLQSYRKAYAIWSQHGDDASWTRNILIVCLLGTLALFETGRYKARISFCAAVAQCIFFLGAGLMFCTNPPQTGISYFTPALGAAWLARESYRGL